MTYLDKWRPQVTKVTTKKSTEKPLLSLSLFPLLFALRGELQIMDYPDYKLYFPGSLCSIYRITQIQHDETRIDINMFHRDCSDISYCCNDINFGVTSTSPLATRSKGGVSWCIHYSKIFIIPSIFELLRCL